MFYERIDGRSLHSGQGVLLKGAGADAIHKYFHSNKAQDEGMSWGSLNEALNWRIEWSSSTVARSCRNQLPSQDLQCVDVKNHLKKSKGLVANVGETQSSLDGCHGWKGEGGQWLQDYARTCSGLVSGEAYSGIDVDIYGNSQKKYLYSNRGDNGKMSWGGKNAAMNWKLEWDGGGPLTSGTVVHLYGKASTGAAGKYLYSTSPENGALVWGPKDSAKAWRVEFSGSWRGPWAGYCGGDWTNTAKSKDNPSYPNSDFKPGDGAIEKCRLARHRPHTTAKRTASSVLVRRCLRLRYPSFPHRIQHCSPHLLLARALCPLHRRQCHCCGSPHVCLPASRRLRSRRRRCCHLLR